jgi:hypothetical protein
MGVLSGGPDFIEEVNPEQRAALRAWTLNGNMQKYVDVFMCLAKHEELDQECTEREMRAM